MWTRGASGTGALSSSYADTVADAESYAQSHSGTNANPHAKPDQLPDTGRVGRTNEASQLIYSIYRGDL